MTKPIILLKDINHCMSFMELIFNFLASADTKLFSRIYLFAMLLLIGLGLFIPRVFCLAYHYFLEDVITTTHNNYYRCLKYF